MAAYGTDSPEWQALPWEWAAERLIPNRNYWVVTVSAAGAPHALPVWGVWNDDDLRFMFSCAAHAHGRPATSRRIHGSCSRSTDTVECISVEGTAAPITDPARIDTWVERYVAKYGSEITRGPRRLRAPERDVRGRADQSRSRSSSAREFATSHPLALPLTHVHLAPAPGHFAP